MLKADRIFLNFERVGAVLLAALASLLLLTAHDSAASTPKITDIRIDPSILTLAPAETKNLTAFADYDDGSLPKDVTAEVVFESRDEEVVQITGRTVKAVGAGETIIRVPSTFWERRRGRGHRPPGHGAVDPAREFRRPDRIDGAAPCARHPRGRPHRHRRDVGRRVGIGQARRRFGRRRPR
jgi:hypothetical protein